MESNQINQIKHNLEMGIALTNSFIKMS